MDKKISFIIPVLNEENSVEQLSREIKENIVSFGSEYEIIFINDGSTDNTGGVLRRLYEADRNIKVINFRKNFGKADAYQAGFEMCTGDIVFTLDGDLQDNPRDIKKFLHKLNEGYDLVIGWKKDRKDSKSKIIQSRLFNFILKKITKLELHDFDNGYRCMKKEILPHLELYEGLYRYIPVFAAKLGFRISEVEVNHRERKYGKSKYGPSRVFKGFFDLITLAFISIYLKKPLHFFGGIGSVLFLIGLSIAAYLTGLKFFTGASIGTRPLLTFATLSMIVGIQLTLFGLLGEMIAQSSKKEKRYSIKNILK